MSTPANILAQYSSYTYHHILIACDSSLVAEELATINDKRLYLRPVGQKNRYDRIESPKGSGYYVIMIDGLTDADFVMDNLSWSTTTAIDASIGSHFTSLATEGSFTVSEPRGIRFFDKLNYICDGLDTDPTGIVWLLKTIFIGRKFTVAEGKTVDYIANVPPFLFMIYDIKGSFTIAGGEYTISFSGLNDGAARMPQTTRVVQGVNLSIKKAAETGGNTLKNVLKQLEKEVNKKYISFYNQVIKKLQSQQINQQFRKVRYEIDVDFPYDKDDYRVDDTNSIQSDSNNPEDGILTFGQSPTLESAILDVLARCSLIKKDTNIAKGSKQKYIPKIITTARSDSKEYVISYKVRRFSEQTYDVIGGILTGKKDPKLNKLIQDNLITFDYIYTGTNTDIIDMDIKMEQGLTFFQTLTTTDSYMDTNTKLASGRPKESKFIANDLNPKGNVFRKKSVLFPDTSIKNNLRRNVGKPDETGRYEAALARHAALEQLETVITIAGNPSLITSYNLLPSEYIKDPQTRSSQTSTSTSSAASADKPTFPNWDTFPAIALINIRMPSSSKNLYGDATEPFWYPGYYYIYMVEHHFKDGLFTQTLNMISLPSNLVQNTDTQSENIADYAGKSGSSTPPSNSAGDNIPTATYMEYDLLSGAVRQVTRRITSKILNQPTEVSIAAENPINK